ncbi:DUF3307 domain-containing protein [Polymorphospora rubra]|uniref:DUF3307 domain-containing protein n=1 Tax=Polymorphospora rubra TaxID=338584 RepID=UPI0033D179D5
MIATATFAAVFAALFVAHSVGDHWIQTQHQADHKGLPGWAGRIACAAHVATYTATAVVALAAVALVLDLPLHLGQVAAGLTVSAVTHYIADRRWPLRWLACKTGSERFWVLGAPRADHNDNPSLGTGAYALDQSWHHGWLLVAALIIAA